MAARQAIARWRRRLHKIETTKNDNDEFKRRVAAIIEWWTITGSATTTTVLPKGTQQTIANFEFSNCDYIEMHLQIWTSLVELVWNPARKVPQEKGLSEASASTGL